MLKRATEVLRLLTQQSTPAPLGEPMGDVLRFFHPVFPSSRLKREPLRVIIANVAYVLFRDGNGRIGAFKDACPHRLAPLSAGRVRDDGRLECPYHGWNFDVDGHGKSPTQPELTRCDAEAFQAVDHHGYVWLAHRGVSTETLPSLDAPGFEDAGVVDMLFDAPLHVALDNFSEDEHTPWVHTRFGWDERGANDVDIDARNFDDRTEVKYRAVQRPSAMARLLLLQPGDVFHNEWVTRFDPVRTDYAMFWTAAGDDGEVRPLATRAVIFFVPETERTTRYHAFIQVKAHRAWVKPAMPLLRKIALGLGWLELDDDRRFVPLVANTPVSTKGMRLGRYDKPIIHNRKLLQRIYLGESPVASVLRAVP